MEIQPSILRSIAHAAERLGVCRDTVRRLTRAGELRMIRVAGRTLIPESEILRVCSEGAGGRRPRRRRAIAPGMPARK
jgi:excisionase family DNA binding protein